MCVVYVIGAMPMPADFPYRDVFLKGKPKHERYDAFRIRHPLMPCSQRAKIFAPFDALRGFGDAVAAKDVLYCDRAAMGPEEQEEMNRRLTVLHNLTFNGRMARANRVQVSVTYYECCSDPDHDAFGLRGRYKTISGTCRKVDAEITGTILVDEQRIPIEDILRIESPGGIFEKKWEEDQPADCESGC